MSGIEVSGGAHGLAVGLQELEESADRLRRLGSEVGEVAAGLGLTAIDPRLGLAGLLAPLELADVERSLLACTGPTGAVGAAADLVSLALVTTSAVRTYRAGEDAVEALTDGIATGVGRWAGRTVAPVAVVLGVAAAPTIATVLRVPGARDAAVSVGLGLGQGVDEILFDHPWLVPAAADGLDGLILGLGEGVPGLGLWMAWRSGRTGATYPPRTHAEAVGVVLAAARGIALDESDRAADVRARTPTVGRAPTGVADLVGPTGPTSGGSRLRITGIPQADGTWAWVVDIPGTRDFTPRAGAMPYDMTTNVVLVAGQTSLTMRAVERALRDARRQVGDTGPPRVMTTGHSQGGIAAAALAADPDLRRRLGITHVVTSAAPVAHLGVPQDVSVLSIEHDEDLVPALEGADNPDRDTWVTVRRSLADELGDEARSTQTHDNGRYTDTARMVDASGDPSVDAWREGASPFVGRPGTPTVTIDYDIERR